MKFAIRKLAISCVLPTALWQGPMMSDVCAQNLPTANSKFNAGMPQKRTALPKKPAPAKQSAPVAEGQPQYPAAQPPVVNRPAPVYQVANPALQQPPQQQQQQSNNAGGPETDVQRQLRLLYQKSGQEMPVMDMNELEVPEPQPGVAPGSSPGGPGGAPRAPGQYAQPPVPPQKTPNLFERVFLGKKAPPPQPAQQPRAPMVQPQIRPGQPNGTPGMPPTNNYRPYQPGQQPAVGQGTQGYNGGPRPSTGNAPSETTQPAPTQQPQVQLQRPVGQPQVIPPQPYGQGPAQSVQQTPPRIQNPPQYNPQPSASGSPLVVPPQIPAGSDEVPLLDEEPEESLEIDVNPNPTSQPLEGATPAVKSLGAAPTSVPVSDDTPNPDPEKSVEATEPAPVEENPFSGLRLSIPEAAGPAPTGPAPAGPGTPAAGPVPTALPSPSPAANATLPSNADRSPLPTTDLPAAENPFLDDEDLIERQETTRVEKAAPVKKLDPPTIPPAAKVAAPPVTIPTVVKPAEIAPILPPAKSAAPASKTVAAPQTKTADQPTAKSSPISAADERLKKLAEAREKTGLKGFCPVALRQRGQLIETKPQFNTTYQGKKFHFSTIAAKVAFEAEPQLFIPVHDGLDSVALLDDKKSVPGSLDHAVWYQGRLYLFASQENRGAFVSDPDLYLDDDKSKKTVVKSVSTPTKVVQPAAPKQQAPATIPTNLTLQPTVKAQKPAALPNDLPVLSETLDDLPSSPAAAASTTPAPATKTPAPRAPALVPAESGKANSSTREAPGPVVPKPGVQPTVTPPSIQPGPRLESPILKKATKARPASYVVPAQPASPQKVAPRLISPDLRLAPQVRQ